MKAARALDNEVLEALEVIQDNILRKINCVSIGRIEKVNYEDQTVGAFIIYKRLLSNGQVKDYPLLLDVPFFVLQGGATFIEMPIVKGDFCILLFCDHNFSTWWDSGNEKEPESLRIHSLSDGIALVGISPKTRVMGLDGKRARIKTDKPLVMDAEKIVMQGGGPAAARKGDQIQSTMADDTAFWTWISAAAGALAGLGVVVPAPSSLSGKITEGSQTVEIG